jgi:plastocyanin
MRIATKAKKRQSPVQQNPTVDVGVEMQGLRLAINTAQTGRTFQDRSHVFRVMAKPIAAANNQPVSTLANKNIINVSVQGKRGNIVQTFPAVEYDFWPKIVNMNVGDCLAFQWTGSNTHNNGNPGGDGQTGDAGEG